jgi:SAM-dependent methyltransferase
MPPESLWTRFFTPEQTLTALGLTDGCRNAVDFGCGYGTFSIPAAKLIRGTVYALDIDPEMIDHTKAKAEAEHLANLVVRQCDFLDRGTGLVDAVADYVMLFNILHAERPDVLLREATRILNSSGILAVMHWNYDATTPRGPSMKIRPRSEQCRELVAECGFSPEPLVPLAPHHYGFVAKRRLA